MPTATCSWRRGVFLHMEHLHATVPSSDPSDPIAPSIVFLVCYHHGIMELNCVMFAALFTW